MQLWRSLTLVGVLVGTVFLALPEAAQGRTQSARWTEPGAQWPRPEVLRAASRAFRCGREHFDQPLLTVIDYSLPSTEPRMWVIDLLSKRVLFHELVAHGINSGENIPTSFSDTPESKMSSLGLFRTAETYVGKHGLSLRLDGLEPGFNERARERAIVMHGAPYVSATAIAKLDFLGRSWGCPAVSQASHQRVIERIKGGSALFIYYPDSRWLSDSEFLNCEEAGTRVARR